MMQPFFRFRPTKQDIGGESTEVLGASDTMFGFVMVHEEQVIIEGVDVNEDVKVGDLIKIVNYG